MQRSLALLLYLGLLHAPSCSAPRSAGPGAPPAKEPYPLGPEMVLLERDASSEEYRRLLHAMITNDLNVEWQRASGPDSPDHFLEEHGGAAQVEADPALRKAHERRKEIAERYLALLRLEYASRRQEPPSESAAPSEPVALKPAASADPDLSIEPIYPAAGAERQWPRWRGPGGQGLSGERDLPLHWSRDTAIVWKTEIP